MLAIDGFTTHTSRSLPSSPLPPGRGAARRPVEDLPARTRHRVQDLVQATADNRRRTGQATRRERYHTEPGIARDGRACARLATAGGPPRGAPARMASCRRGRHEPGFGALVAKARSGRAHLEETLYTSCGPLPPPPAIEASVVTTSPVGSVSCGPLWRQRHTRGTGDRTSPNPWAQGCSTRGSTTLSRRRQAECTARARQRHSREGRRDAITRDSRVPYCLTTYPTVSRRFNLKPA